MTAAIKGKTRCRISAIICVIVAMLSLASCGSTEPDDSADEKDRTATEQSSFEYKNYKKGSQYRKAFEDKMRGAYEVMNAYMDDDKSFPIPGIIETYIRKKNGSIIQRDYVPQGLCKAGQYYLVTAYDGSKENNSVIYVVDKAERIVVSTLTLPHRYHSGGIAFDGERIWLTGDTSDKYEGKPFLQYIEFPDFMRMTEEPLHRITNGEISGKVYIKNKPSFLEYSDGILWVGTYVASKSTERGYINGYPVSSENGKVRLDTMMYYVINGIDSSAQGAAVYGSYLYVSSSYMGWLSRVKTSFVTMYDIEPLKTGDTQINLSGKEIRRIEVPKMNEEILIDQGILYINFESAYDGWPAPVIRTDRIIAVRRNLWR